MHTFFGRVRSDTVRLVSGTNVMILEVCDQKNPILVFKKNNPGCRYIYRINNSVGCLHHGFSVEIICRAKWFATAVAVEGCLPTLWQLHHRCTLRFKQSRLSPEARGVLFKNQKVTVTSAVALRGWATARSHRRKTARASAWDYLPWHWEYPILVEFKIILSVCVRGVHVLLPQYLVQLRTEYFF